MGIDLDNTNQVLLKPEFFAINVLEATHESPINDEIILKEVKAALLSDEVTKDYKSLLKSGPREFEKSLQDWNYENGLCKGIVGRLHQNVLKLIVRESS